MCAVSLLCSSYCVRVRRARLTVRCACLVFVLWCVCSYTCVCVYCCVFNLLCVFPILRVVCCACLLLCLAESVFSVVCASLLLHVFAVLCRVSCGRAVGTVARTVSCSQLKSQWLAQTEVTEMALILTVAPCLGLGRPAGTAQFTDGEPAGLSPASWVNRTHSGAWGGRG